MPPFWNTILRAVRNHPVPFLILLLILTSIPDLFSPPLSSTSWRQTQTAMLTQNFANHGFDLEGMYVNILGDSNPLMIYELPLLNALAGMSGLLFGNTVFFGKLYSLIASIILQVLLYSAVLSFYDDRVALVMGTLFALTPINLLMRTSFQPDAIALLFVVSGLFMFWKWTMDQRFLSLCLSLLFLGMAALLKYPIVVPYIPVCVFLGFVFFKRMNRKEILISSGLVVLLVVFPVCIWYLHYSRLSDPLFIQDSQSMFLIGDLSRFVDPKFYLKPAFIYFFYVFSGIGVTWFAWGLKGLRLPELCILLGIPLFAFVIPTSAVQHYYQMAITPISSLFMAKGFILLWDRKNGTGRRMTLIALMGLFILVTSISALYLLRQDSVFESAARSVRRHSQPNEKLLSLALHDRVYTNARWYTEMHFLAERKGWNLQYDSEDSGQNILTQIEEKRGTAKYMILTRYTSDLEPWFVDFIPDRFSRNPDVDTRALAQMLEQEYRVLEHDKNFVLFRLD